MLIILVITLILVVLRLWGATSEIYKTCSHVFCGGLLGYDIASHNWMTILMAVLLIGVEGYSFAAKIFPSIALSNLIKKL